MALKFEPSPARGAAAVPGSKSMAHRLLLCAALSGGPCTLEGVTPSRDVLATLSCLEGLGAEVRWEGDRVTLTGIDLSAAPAGPLCCGDSASTLRFLIPLLLLGRQKVTLTGSRRLMERPLGPYQTLCRERTLLFYPEEDRLYLRGPLQPGLYQLPGDVSSQFVSGLLFALPLLEAGSVITLTPPVSSRSYIEMTRRAQALFGVTSVWTDENTLRVFGGQTYTPRDARVEGDWSAAAFLEGLNLLGGSVTLTGLDTDSLQGDKIYREYYKLLAEGTPVLDIDQCPDLGPVLMALAAANRGVRLTGTRRLALKESDRAAVMAQELAKFGAVCRVEQDALTVTPGLTAPTAPVCSHGDHRVAMALALLLSRTGGVLEGEEAADKSFPGFFDCLRELGIDLS